MNGSPTVLVVDDERPMVDLLAGYLAREGFRVVRAYDGTEALDLARRESPDLVVLDVMLPAIDGLEVCRRLRTFSDAYVLMLTARTEEFDKVVGLATGADDYVTKPFSPRELVARVRALLRRPRTLAGAPPASPPSAVRVGELVVDHAAREVTHNGVPLSLTRHEFDLLATLAERPGTVYTRAQLLDRVWDGEFFGDDHVIDVHLGNLRRKLQGAAGDPGVIETVRGVGYRLRREGQ